MSGFPPPLPSSFANTAFKISPALRFFFLAASFVATTTFTLSAVIPPPITTAALSPSWPRTFVTSSLTSFAVSSPSAKKFATLIPFTS